MADVADPETASALNFYALLGAAAAKSTTSSALKTASARLSRPPFVALINRPASIVRFNKVQQSGARNTVAFCLVCGERSHAAFILPALLPARPPARPPPPRGSLLTPRSCEGHIFFFFRAIFFLRNRAVTQLLWETRQLAEFTTTVTHAGGFGKLFEE